jgi:hypothetical protein
MSAVFLHYQVSVGINVWMYWGGVFFEPRLDHRLAYFGFSLRYFDEITKVDQE